MRVVSDCEFLLALASDRQGADGIHALACDTDGIDFFSALRDPVVTAPTRTNVNDYRAILVL